MGEEAHLLDAEIKYYESSREEFLKKFLNKVVLIKGEKLIGVFDSEEQAYQEGIKHFGNTAFLIKRVEPQSQEQVAWFPAFDFGLVYATI